MSQVKRKLIEASAAQEGPSPLLLACKVAFLCRPLLGSNRRVGIGQVKTDMLG